MLYQVPVETRLNCWYKHDGENFIESTVLKCWVGRGGPILSCPRLPDLNPLDFFFLGILERKGFLRTVERAARIHDAVTFVNENILQRIQ